MINLEYAKELTYKKASQTRYNKLVKIREDEQGFIASYSDGSKGPGGNLYFSVDKISGECEEFEFLSREGMERYYKAKIVA